MMQALGFMGGLGGLVGLMWWLSGVSGATAAKTGAAAISGAGTVVRGVEPPEPPAAPPPEPEPSIGDRRTYTDQWGSQQTEIFNGQNWTDPQGFAQDQARTAENEAWQRDQASRQANHDTAFDRQLAEQKAEWERKAAADRQANRKALREMVQTLQDCRVGDQGRAQADADRADRSLQRLEMVKTVADLGVQTLGEATGPLGWAGSNLYTMATETAGGVSEAVVNATPGQGALRTMADGLVGGMQGAARGAVNVVVSEGLNVVGAVATTAVKGGVQAIPRHLSFTEGYRAVGFESPVPLPQVIGKATNLLHGREVYRVNDALAHTPAGTVLNNLVGGGGLKEFVDTASQLGTGAVRGLRSALIDNPIGNTACDGVAKAFGGGGPQELSVSTRV